MPAPGDNPGLDAETQAPIIIGISVAFLLAAAVTVLLRLYTRCILVRTYGFDDLLISFALVLSLGVSVTSVLQTKYGLGKHVWMVTEDETMVQLKCLFASMVIYNLAQILTKLSFLFLYRRIFIDKTTKKLCLGMIGFLIVWGIVQELLVGFSCNPVAIIIPALAGRCITALAVWYLTSIMNIVTDFVVFVIPIPAIVKLQLAKRQRFLVATIFCLGFFTCVISIIRLFTLASATNTTDPTWDNVPTSWWSVVELNCGILCASLPTLRPLLRSVTGELTRDSVTSPSHQQKSSEHSTSDTRNLTSYALHEIEAGGSQEVLKEHASCSRDGAESVASSSQNGASSSHRFTRDLYGPKNAHKITTAISGGIRIRQGPETEPGKGKEGLPSGGGGPQKGQGESHAGITVTTETRLDESRRTGRGPRINRT